MTTSPLYLRDLKPDLQDSIKRNIVAQGDQKLIDALEAGDDIEVGGIYYTQDFEVA